jgi:hypothetical protein
MGTMDGNRLPSIARHRQMHRPRPYCESARPPIANDGELCARFHFRIGFALSSAVNFALVSPTRSMYRNLGEARYPDLAGKVFMTYQSGVCFVSCANYRNPCLWMGVA